MNERARRPETRGRELRALWATLAAICLLGAGLAYGATWYTRGELEREATRDARQLAVDAIQPLLLPADVEAPVRGERYEELLAAVEEGVLGGPINGLRLWRADGTILFAVDRNLVGRREPAMRDEIHAVVAGTSQSMVEGDRFRMLSTLRVGEPAVLVAAELDRSYPAIVEEAEEPWYPWVRRGLVAALVFAGLMVVTWIGFAIADGIRRAAARSPKAPARPAIPGVPIATSAGPGSNGDPPPYMLPGFQEQVEAKRRAEDALKEMRQERDEVLERVRRLEAELDELRRGRGEPEPSSRVLPMR
jgi:hypothetical protein